MVVALAILGCLPRLISPVSAAPAYNERDGLLVIEAENFHSKANTSFRDWYIIPTASPTPTPDPDPDHSSDAGGGQYVEILPDTRVTLADTLEYGVNFFETGHDSPRLNYRVRINTPGRYYARIRAYPLGTEDNSVHVGLNDTWPLSGWAVQWCDGETEWTWSGAQRVPGNPCGITNALYLDLTAGDHTLMLGMREDGFEMDRIIFTTDPDYFPTGIGPAAFPEIELPPMILTQPAPETRVFIDDTVTLSVLATGDGPLAYQWTKNGADLEEATSPVLTLADVQMPDSGTYGVRVSNSNGSVTSSDAVVTVSGGVPAPILEQPTVVNGSIIITWTNGGELESATDLNGPWLPSGNSSGSFTEPLGSGNKFFRIKLGP